MQSMGKLYSSLSCLTTHKRKFFLDLIMLLCYYYTGGVRGKKGSGSSGSDGGGGGGGRWKGRK